MTAVEWIWMRHPGTGGVARFTADTEKVWSARGWERCEEPAEEPAHLRDVSAPRAEDQGQKTRRAARRGGETQED